MTSEDGPRIDLAEIGRTGNLQLARAFAIEKYANMEAMLSRLLAGLLNTSHKKASIIFFNLLSTRPRNSMFESLIQATHGNTYKTFWRGQRGKQGRAAVPGLLTLIRQVDEQRNKIVHWHTVMNVYSNSSEDVTQVIENLAKPDFWHRAEEAAFIGVEEMIDFIAKTEFITRLISMFDSFTTKRDQLTAEAAESWPKLFLEPVAYPPADSHPLYSVYTESFGPTK